MNERIRELYDQALVLEGNGDYTAGELDPEKFAELIIRECASLCDKDYERCGQDGAGWYLARTIEEHFGVENEKV